MYLFKLVCFIFSGYISRSGIAGSSVSSVQFSHSDVSDSLRTHESQQARPPCPSPTPGAYSNSQTHVHRVSDAIQPSHSLLSPSSPTFNFTIPWTIAHQAPLSMGFSKQESWSGLPFPSPEELLDPGVEPGSPALQADSLLTQLQGKP